MGDICGKCRGEARYFVGFYLQFPPSVPNEDKRCAMHAAEDACDDEKINRLKDLSR